MMMMMRMASAFVRQISFADDLKDLICTEFISLGLLQSASSWIGSTSNEDADLVALGVTDNLFGTLANLTMRQPALSEKLCNAYPELPALIKLSLGTYAKQ